ncbi:permease [Paenibacillus ginsengarvi]|uniref:Permease n=2 Tax=Paenibacillus ginsengarvi TaxID=400777 RepID=A0A3B0CJ04_9BACL|nr:permease [Paenibacillus ginsengarvi]
MLASAAIVVAMNPVVFTALPPLLLADLQSFKTMLIGIVLEALPFILLGVLVSSLMQLFISEKTIRRLVPRNPLLGILFACALGILFPICECGLIPVVRKLLAKGMPLYIAVVFIVVGPVVNPVVFAATYVAFRGNPAIVYSRMGLALLVGVLIGLIVYRFVRINPLRSGKTPGDRAHSDEHMHDHGHEHHREGKLFAMLRHAADEFFDMGKFLLFGSVVTAAIQTFIPRQDLLQLGQGEYGSHLFMMGFAYILSLCSTSDAFVAASLATTFTSGSLLTFLVFGPMLDFKSTLMLLAVFRARFVVLLAIAIAVFVLAGSLWFESLFL